MQFSGLVVGAVLVASLFAGAGLLKFKQTANPPATELRWHNTVDRSIAYPTYTALTDREKGRNWAYPSVSVYSIPYTPPAPAPLTLKDLSDNGQAHAIDYIFKAVDGTGKVEKEKNPNAVDAQGALQNFITAISAQSNDARVDPYRANRVLIASVAKGLDALPGDRLVWTRIFIKPINFKFAGYSVVASDNRTIKIATVENTTENKLSIKATPPSVGGASSGVPETSSETDKSQKTTVDVNESYENLGVDIQPGFMRIIRESAKDGDVVGNTTVQLSMVTDPTQIWCRHLDTDVGKAQATAASQQQAASSDAKASPPCGPPKDHAKPIGSNGQPLDDQFSLLISSVRPDDNEDQLRPRVLPQLVLPHCPLTAAVWMLYETRVITQYRDHIIEGNQDVQLRRNGYDAGIVEIVPADDISPAVWTIKVTKGGDPLNDQSPDLAGMVTNGSARRLVFTDYLTASQLAHWLKVKLAKPQMADTDPTSDNMTFLVRAGPTLTPYKTTAPECPFPEPLPLPPPPSTLPPETDTSAASSITPG